MAPPGPSSRHPCGKLWPTTPSTVCPASRPAPAPPWGTWAATRWQRGGTAPPGPSGRPRTRSAAATFCSVCRASRPAPAPPWGRPTTAPWPRHGTARPGPSSRPRPADHSPERLRGRVVHLRQRVHGRVVHTLPYRGGGRMERHLVDGAADGQPGWLRQAPPRQRVLCPGRRLHRRGQLPGSDGHLHPGRGQALGQAARAATSRAGTQRL